MGSRTLVGAILAATVLYGVATAALGTPPSTAASGEQVVVWFSENADRLRWMVWALTLTGPLLAIGAGSRLPRWLGILGVIAIVEQAVETVTIFGTTEFTEPGGPMNLQLGAAFVCAWLLAFALWAGWRGPESHPSAA